MQIYNTFTKKLEEFKPLKNGEVKMYSCGPTVYSRAHLGNFSAYIFSDLLARWLAYRHEFKVGEAPIIVHKISNITDVGHLTSDGDTGEDKMEKAAKEQQKSVLEIARHWEKLYRADEMKLNILPAEKYPRATEYIEQMIAITEKLVEKGYAYENEDGIYFDVTKFPDYGKLSGNTLENLNVGAGGRVSETHQLGKHNPADFALWKKLTGENSKHSLHWPSPWGEGFPGWHIECSAMILANLGEQIDIHTGGEDNIFPHHECEIAQMEAYTDKQPFCKYWLHKRFIQLNAEKMSKSKGNVLNLDDIIEKGYDPLDIRYLFLSVHYRQQLNFTWESLESAKQARKKIQNMWEEIKPNEATDQTSKYTQEFFDFMEDDLNVSGALSAVFAALKNENNHAKLKNFLEKFDHVFAILNHNQKAETEIPQEIQAMLKERELARKNKNWAESDRLRDKIADHGYLVTDGKNGQTVEKK